MGLKNSRTQDPSTLSSLTYFPPILGERELIFKVKKFLTVRFWYVSGLKRSCAVLAIPAWSWAVPEGLVLTRWLLSPFSPSYHHLCPPPIQWNAILISFLKNQFVLAHVHPEGLCKREKSKLFASMYSIWDVSSRRKTLPNQRLLLLKHHVFITVRQKTAPSFQWHHFLSPFSF